MGLLTMWILSTVVGIIIFSVLFLWAVRSGQFRDQQRARRLPLERPPETGPSGEPVSKGEGD
jgi:cbb3-type cytochrome oxidase maturation protein